MMKIHFVGFLGISIFLFPAMLVGSQEKPVIGVVSLADETTQKILNANGNLEQVRNGRLVSVEGFQQGYQVHLQEGREQSTAAYCEAANNNQAFGLHWSFILNQTEPDAVRFSGWSRAEAVEGAADSDYSLYIDIVYKDGTTWWGQNAPFNAGTHDWEEKKLLATPDKPIRQLDCYALFRNHKGRVWFDDFTISTSKSPQGMSKFDGLAAYINRPLPTPSNPKVYQIRNGLQVTFDSGGFQVIGIENQGTKLPLADAPSGFLVRDVSRESGYYPFLNGNCAALDLDLQCQVEIGEQSLRLFGKVSDRTKQPRAISLVFVLPIAAENWRWWDHIRSSRIIQNGNEYTALTTIGVGTHGKISLYPYACIASDNAGIALGLDLGSPAQWRLGYSAGLQLFYLAYDFGVHPEVEKYPAEAPFSFVIYHVDPAWGLRSAAETYAKIFPAYFTRLSRDQGIWMPFTDIATVQGWQDFGFKYHEGNNNVPFDDQANVLSFRYSEPSTWWMSMPASIPRTYDSAMAMVKQYAEGSSRTGNQIRAKSLLASGSQDETGRFQLVFRNEPWTNGAVFSLNPSPYLAGEVTNASEMWNETLAQRLYGPNTKGVQDGEYLDSLEGYVTADLNFRIDHIRRSTVPLTFTLDTRRPVIYKAFSFYEFTRYISAEMHKRNKLLFANAVPYRYGFLCPWLDIMGTEIDWIRDGQFAPDSDETMNYRRTLSYQKPYLFLMNTRFDQMSSERVEQYFQRCLFYGMFPSMFSHNASEDPYWKNSTLYNRDRPLFKKYQPLIKQVAEAGWEPVTQARTDQTKIWVERFGPNENKQTYFTVLNSGSETIPFHLAGEKNYIEKGNWQELTHNESGVWEGGLNAQLSPNEVRVYQVTFPDQNPTGIPWQKETNSH